MTNTIHQSLELPGYWAIRWYGKLQSNPGTNHHDLRILTFLRKILVQESSGEPKGKLEGPFVTANLPVGELPLLPINSVLLDGCLVEDGYQILSEDRTLTRRLDCHPTKLRVFDRFHKDESGDLIVPAPKGARANPNGEHNANFVGFEVNNEKYAVVIPAVEIFRFFYATSDVLTKSALSDRFLDPNTYLWSISNTAIDASGRAAIWLRRKMLDADAKFLARFAFDSYALKQAQEIFLRTAAIGNKRGERMIHALPPFNTPAEFKFLCRNLPSNNGLRLFVTRIIQCDWKPPFTELKWDRDNDGRLDKNNRDERPVSNMPAGTFSTPDQNTPAPSALAVEAPSGAGLPSRLSESEISERFPELGKIPAIKLPQSDTKTRSEPKNWRAFMSEAYQGSVIDGQSSGQLIGRTVIEGIEKRQNSRPTATDDIDPHIGSDTYRQILDLILGIRDKSLARVDFLLVLEDFARVRGIEFNVYPGELDGRQKAWLYADQKNRRRRLAFLVRVEHEGSPRYVLELQQRESQKISTLVMWNQSGADLAKGALIMMLMDCAHKGSATLPSASDHGISWARLHHTFESEASKTAEHYLNRILTAPPIEEPQ